MRCECLFCSKLVRLQGFICMGERCHKKRSCSLFDALLPPPLHGGQQPRSYIASWIDHAHPDAACAPTKTAAAPWLAGLAGLWRDPPTKRRARAHVRKDALPAKAVSRQAAAGDRTAACVYCLSSLRSQPHANAHTTRPPPSCSLCQWLVHYAGKA